MLIYKVSVDVYTPGVIKLNVDKVTIIDAFIEVGDITEFTKGDNAEIIRAEADYSINHQIDAGNKSIANLL